MKDLEFGQPNGPEDWKWVYGALQETREASRRNEQSDTDLSSSLDRLDALEAPFTIIVPVAGAAKLGGSGAGWVIDGDNALPLATLPASQTAEVILIPITGLRVGDTVTGVGVVGQVESAGNNVTLTLDVRKVTAAAADITDASLGTDGSGTLVADTILSTANLGVTGLTETMAADESLYVTITATTGVATDIALMSLVVAVTR